MRNPEENKTGLIDRILIRYRRKPNVPSVVSTAAVLMPWPLWKTESPSIVVRQADNPEYRNWPNFYSLKNCRWTEAVARKNRIPLQSLTKRHVPAARFGFQACPVDAIVGTGKMMHTVINDYCSRL